MLNNSESSAVWTEKVLLYLLVQAYSSDSRYALYANKGSSITLREKCSVTYVFHMI